MKLLREVNRQITFEKEREIVVGYKEWELNDRSIEKSLVIEFEGEYVFFDEEGIRSLHDYLDDIVSKWPIVISQEYEIAERKPESPQDARYKEILRHTLGLNYETKPFRNRYITHERADSWADLIEMEKVGLVERVRTPMFLNKDDVVFYATAKGYAFVGAFEVEE